MSQYITGTVTVTNGSAVVTGTGTAWLANVAAGYMFTIADSGVAYEVGSVDSDGQATLTGVYTGASASGQSYAITTGFTSPDSIPAFEQGDIEAGTINKRAIYKIQAIIVALRLWVANLVTSNLNDRGNYNASGNTFPASGGSGTAGAIVKGDYWYISVAGTLGGTAVAVGDTVRALVDAPGQTAGNWGILSASNWSVPQIIHAATEKTIPADADEVGIRVSSGLLNRLTWANLKAVIATYYNSFTATLTNKSISLGSNTLTGTKVQFDTACSDGDFAYQSDLTAKESTANKAVNFATVNDTLYPTVRAAKEYADGLLTALIDDRGNYDASGNVWPSTGGSGGSGAIVTGDAWWISVAGTLGGVSVSVGYLIRAIADAPGQTASNWGILSSPTANVPSIIHAATSKTTPADNDELALVDSAASYTLKRLTWANLKAAIKSYYDSVTATLTNKTLTSAMVTATLADNTATLAVADAKFMQHQIASGAGGKWMAQGVELLANATSGIGVPDNNNLDIGTGNYTLAWRGRLPNWNVATRLLGKNSGTVGTDLYITAAQIPYVNISGHANSPFTSTVAMPSFSPYSSHSITASVTRETASTAGSVAFYVDGWLLDTVTIPAAAPVSVDNASTVYSLGTSSTANAGVTEAVYLFNYAISATGALALYRYGVRYMDKGGSQTPLYISDFSAGTQGWGPLNGTATGNIDGIGGENDWLSLTLDTTNSYHYLTKSNLLTTYKRYKVAFKYFIPSTNSVVDGISFRVNNGSFTPNNAPQTVLDTATAVSFEVEETTGGVSFWIQARDGTATDFQDVGGDDVIYIKNIVITPLGAVLALEPEGIQPTQWHDSSSNELHASYPSAGASLTRWQHEGTHHWNTAITGDTTLTSMVPAGYELEGIMFYNSTANSVDAKLGTTAGGTEVFAATTIPAGFKFVACNKAFSLTAAQTLYLSSALWNSASLTFSLRLRRFT